MSGDAGGDGRPDRANKRTVSGFTLREGDAGDPAIVALIAFHLEQAQLNFPAGFAYALKPDALLDPEISLFSLWEGDLLAGIGALRSLLTDHAEIKTMRTAPAFLGRGVGRAILNRLIEAARGRGIRRLSLETGTSPPFAAAHALYESAGFVDCAAFGGYRPSSHNRFMTLTL